jgi:magnesium chelatase family protein
MTPAATAPHVFIVAPPGAGKTRYARHLARQSRRWQGKAEGELSAIYRYAGLEAPKWWERGGPFRAPHHTVSEAGMTGVFREGWIIRPGELSLAHAGVLLLDEAAEFPRRVLEVIEQAARDGSVGFTGGSTHPGFVRLPASFQLVVATNPCPCGQYGQPVRMLYAGRGCQCTEERRERYLARVAKLRALCTVELDAVGLAAELGKLPADESSRLDFERRLECPVCKAGPGEPCDAGVHG